MRVVKRLLPIFLVLFFLAYIYYESNRDKDCLVIGAWAVDPNGARIKRSFEWAYPHGLIIFRNNYSVDMPDLWWNWNFDYPSDSVYNTIDDDTIRMAAIKFSKEKKTMKKQGKWKYIKKNADSIEINVKNHPLSGKYFCKTYKEKARRGIYERLILRNDSTYIECFKWKE